MNGDIKKAKELLTNSSATCVLCLGDTVYASERAGIAPMIDFIEDKTDLKGFSAADKIIGRAAALLFSAAGVRAVYGEVMSREALSVLEENGIAYEYGTLTDYIINRKGDGMCPMEETVRGIESPSDAYAALKQKLKMLRSK